MIVNQQALYDVIDQLRVSLPDEIKQAQRTLAEHDRIVAQAREEARRITEQARQHTSDPLDQNPTVADAQQRAQQILQRAQQQSTQFQTEANGYAHDVLTRLAEQLETLQHQIRNGQEILTQMKNSPDPQLPQDEHQNGSIGGNF